MRFRQIRDQPLVIESQPQHARRGLVRGCREGNQDSAKRNARPTEQSVVFPIGADQRDDARC